jgi:putative copper export protein
MDNWFLLLHLVAASFWLGGLILLGIIAVVAARTLDRDDFRLLMSRSGRAFAVGSVIAWSAIAISGAALA